MTISDLHLLSMFCVVILLAAISTCIYSPKITIDLDFRDLIVLFGIVLIGSGFYMIYPASAFIVSGSLLFWLGRPR